MRELTDPVNAPVVEYLLRYLTPAEREWPRFRVEFRSVMEVTIHELCTHPDLGEHLGKLRPAGSDAEWGIIAGMFVLRSAGGTLFAFAWGTNALAMRTGPDRSAASIGLEAETIPELGEDWVKIDPWKPRIPSEARVQWQHALYAEALANLGA